MTRFSARTEARAVVDASREDVWAALRDPDLVARLTPFVRRITAATTGDVEHWHWELSGLDVLGVKVSPAFTERMTFDEPGRIEFTHAPPDGGTERSGVEGWYDLAEQGDGTVLSTRLEVCVDLPLPRVSSVAVTTAMRGVMATMGERFSHRLLDHLGARRTA
ncbi:MAG: SRPBCC family protein [Nocardioides sp.]